MFRFRPLLAVATILLTSTVALAEVPREYRSPLSRATTLITNCEAKMKQVRADFDLGRHRSKGVSVFDRNLNDIADRLEKVKGLAKDFPVYVPELAAMTARIAAFEADLAKLKAQLDGDSQAAAGENASLEAGLGKDKDAAEAVSAHLTDLMGELGTDSRVPDSVKQWAQVKADGTRLGKTYGSSRGATQEAREMVNTVRIMTSTLRIAQGRVERFLREGDAKVGNLMTSAEKEAANAIATRNYDPFMGGIRRNIAAAEIIMEQASLLYAAGEPGDSAWIARQKERITKLNAQAKAQFTQIVSRNELPKDAYSGGDRAALSAAVTKAWLATNPNSPPAKLIFPYSNWSRVSKWAWNDASRSWHKQDYSTQGVAVVVKSKDGKYGYWYMCYPQKDHLAGGSLSVIARPNENSEVPADRTVLIGKVK